MFADSVTHKKRSTHVESRQSYLDRYAFTYGQVNHVMDDIHILLKHKFWNFMSVHGGLELSAVISSSHGGIMKMSKFQTSSSFLS